MASPTDNETWLIEQGDRVIQKKADFGFEQLTTWERLVYSFWAADYGMRNAGSLDAGKDVYADFQSTAFRAAQVLSLPLTASAFSMALDALEEEYLGRFEAVCDEIRSAEPGSASDTANL